jgi:DNA topoisomerase-3
MVDSLKGIAANVGGADAQYAKAGQYVAGLSTLPLGRIVADDKVGDHHAIIPTEGPQDLAGIGPDERKIYDLVARRFLAAFHPPAKKEVTSVDTASSLTTVGFTVATAVGARLTMTGTTADVVDPPWPSDTVTVTS